MKKKSVFLLVLSSLLLFQSMWNIAAAFCTHEKGTVSTYATQMHFGHHSSGHQLTASQENKLLSSQDDHSDHLPSFSPLILVEAQDVLQPVSKMVQSRDDTDWRNLYSSPYLSFNSPPPNLAPL
ncbi:cation efflux protein, CzcI-like [Acinetobacter nectaris]|uniref:cation efflux protein, CzcI-like n=1 Tax=Acinetobacter nectaris TaxID=1219382 RepID=UPI001F4180E9|nr:cation efflux protein, CzcI-like [Acinetobacter nectaris]MCF9034649.1 cation transporter [Acinetobacter nectaris]